MLEVGFGPVFKIEHQQDQMARIIYHDDGVIAVDNRELALREFQKIEGPPRAVFSYNSILLLNGLDRYEAHVGPAHRFTDRFRIVGIETLTL